MASIVLSFVGSQDPHSKHNDEGSIVSLLKHLHEQGRSLKHILLLYTDGTQQNAIDTKDWLLSEIANLTTDRITLIPVSDAFSRDPINQLIAVQEARKAVELAQAYQTGSDTLECNGSSGTPAMKSCWSILQATGYAPHSHVWQVRNPKEMQPGQARVFKNDINALKNEFDSQVIQRQIQDYNYSGALVTLIASNLAIAPVPELLQYGFYRLSFDFDRASDCINPVKDRVDSMWIADIALLRQKDEKALLQEIYWNALIRLAGQKYADFLVSLFKLQEQVLYYLVRNRLGLKVSGERSQFEASLQIIRNAEDGKLYQYLLDYRLPRGDRLDLSRGISRYVLLGIVTYYPQFAALIPLIADLNQYCELRNEAVHGVVGVSKIDDEARLLATLRKLMKQVASIADTNSFDRLNQYVCHELMGTLAAE